MKKEIEKIRKRAYDNGRMKGSEMTSIIPLLVLRDEFGFGQKRMLQYLEKYKEVVSDYNAGRLKLSDIKQVLREEVKIDVE